MTFCVLALLAESTHLLTQIVPSLSDNDGS
jgi:hypothetical protein